MATREKDPEDERPDGAPSPTPSPTPSGPSTKGAQTRPQPALVPDLVAESGKAASDHPPKTGADGPATPTTEKPRYHPFLARVGPAPQAGGAKAEAHAGADLQWH